LAKSLAGRECVWPQVRVRINNSIYPLTPLPFSTTFHARVSMSSSVLPTITIDLVLDRSNTRDVLRGVLHAILFHRLFGTVKARDFEVLDVTMPAVTDPDTEQLVNEKVDAFWRGIEGGAGKRGQIIITMSEKKTKKSWFYAAEQDVPWEQWVINTELRHKSTLDRTFNKTLTATLIKTIHTIVMYTSSERGRSVVPPITDAAGISPFPIKVVVKIGNQEVG